MTKKVAAIVRRYWSGELNAEEAMTQLMSHGLAEGNATDLLISSPRVPRRDR